jgi:lauroyl/myristoyl acyltransferase
VGNWHVGARILHERSGLPVHSVAGTQMMRAWTAGLRLAYRRLGLRIHPRRNASRRLLRALRNHEVVALHLDGDQHEGVGPATRGIHLLARRTGCMILPAITERSGPGTLTLRFLPFVKGGAATPEPEVLASLLVDLVRDHPEQWTLFRPLWERT